MRRLLAISGAVLGVVAVALLPGAAVAAPTTVCTVQDERLPKITGITAVEGGYVVVALDDNVNTLRLFKLDAACKPTRIVNDPIDPNSPQDLASTPDGALWVADVGDDGLERATVAVHKVVGSKATRYRLSYPDGKHNAAALVVQPNGVPVIITKEAGNVAKMYTTAAPLAGTATVPLKPAGTVTMPASTTSGGPVGPGGRTVVTGAALAPDGKKVLIRTFTDAYEWDVQTDVPTAVKGKPRHTPLPSEQDGQAIAYTADGVNFVTISASGTSPLLEWTPAPPPVTAKPPTSTTKKAADSGFSLSDVTPKQIGALVLGVGALGLIMLVVGIVGIVRFRRRIAAEQDDADRKAPMRPNRSPADAALAGGLDDPPGETVTFQKVGGTVYGGGEQPAAAGAAAGRGTVYGGGGGDQAAAGRGTVYGGGGNADRASSRQATVYGAPSEPAAPAVAEPVASSRGTVYGGTTYGSGRSRCRWR